MTKIQEDVILMETQGDQGNKNCPYRRIGTSNTGIFTTNKDGL
jgi:hypothetical protein